MPDDQLFPSLKAPHEVLGAMDYAPGHYIEPKMWSTDSDNRSRFVIIPETKLPGLSIAKLWSGAFCSANSFLVDYHVKRGDKDIEIPPWELNADRSTGYRVMQCTTFVDAPFPNTAVKFYEAQRFVLSHVGDEYKLVIQLSAQTPDVMMGSSFRVESTLTIVSDSLNGDVTMSFDGTMRKLSFGFGAISSIATKRAKSDLRTGYTMMMRMMGERLGGGEIPVPAAPPVLEVVTEEVEAGGGVDVVTIVLVVLSGVMVLFVGFSFFSTRALQVDLGRRARAAHVHGRGSGAFSSADQQQLGGGGHLGDVVDDLLRGRIKQQHVSSNNNAGAILDQDGDESGGDAEERAGGRRTATAEGGAGFAELHVAMRDLETRMQDSEATLGWVAWMCVGQLLLAAVICVLVATK